MDPVQYEKIADKLMQFRGKIPKNETLGDHMARMTCDDMKIKIDSLLMFIWDLVDNNIPYTGNALIKPGP